MFADSPAFSGFAVRDLDEAQTFLTDVLGLRTSRDEDMPLMTVHLAGGRTLLCYAKEGHEPAGYTILNFPVPDVGAAVAELARRGVEVERYPGMPQDTDGVMRGNGPDIAWFTDPSGNVMSVLADQP